MGELDAEGTVLNEDPAWVEKAYLKADWSKPKE
jgi:hypothetical protein